MVSLPGRPERRARRRSFDEPARGHGAADHAGAAAALQPARRQRRRAHRRVGEQPGVGGRTPVGDVILSFNATAITTPGELLRAVNTAIADREVEVRIRRGTDLLTLKATVTTPVPDLSGLEGLLPPDLRDRLSRAYNDGLLGQDLVQQLRNLYSASSGNVLAGAVKSTTTTSVTIALASGEERTLTLSPDALLQRGGSQIRLSDLRQGETVLAVSNNGGQSFFLITPSSAHAGLRIGTRWQLLRVVRPRDVECATRG